MMDQDKLGIIMLIIAFSWNFCTVESSSCTFSTDCPYHQYCCGHFGNEYCCDDLFEKSPGHTRTSWDTDSKGSHTRTSWESNSTTTRISIRGIVSVIGTVILVVIVLFIVFCCCKKRRRGTVYQKQENVLMPGQPLQQQQAYPTQLGGFTAVTPNLTQAQAYPIQSGGYTAVNPHPIQAQAYPAQSGGFAAVPTYPTQAQAYPAQPYPPQQPYTPQQPYPDQYAPPPHMGGDQPPPYAETEKQQPFNPTYVNPD